MSYRIDNTYAGETIYEGDSLNEARDVLEQATNPAKADRAIKEMQSRGSDQGSVKHNGTSFVIIAS